MGGIALGKAVTTSGLLEVMDVLIRNLVSELSPYSVVLALSFMVMVGPITRCLSSLFAEVAW